MASAQVSDFEKRRLQNIADNKRVLAELGLLNPVSYSTSSHSALVCYPTLFFNTPVLPLAVFETEREEKNWKPKDHHPTEKSEVEFRWEKNQ